MTERDPGFRRPRVFRSGTAEKEWFAVVPVYLLDATRAKKVKKKLEGFHTPRPGRSSDAVSDRGNVPTGASEVT